MAIVTDLNGCFVSAYGFAGDSLLNAANKVNDGITMREVENGFLFGNPYTTLISAHHDYDNGHVNQVYFRNGQFHDCAEDEPVKVANSTDEYEVREMGGFKIGEVVSFYRDESFAHCGVTERWLDGEELKIIAFVQTWRGQAPVVQNVRGRQVSVMVLECIKKKMTDAEIKARVIEELADNACEDLFGCSIQNCCNDVAATVRAMIEGDYRKK